jgi:hypothetical protein
VAFDEARLLQSLDDGREGRGVETQHLGDLAEAQRGAAPKREHDEVLRVSEAERFQDRPIDADDAPTGYGEGEAHLSIEFEGVTREFVHALNTISFAH